MQTWYGIDIGGTKIELVACGDDLDIRHRERVATPTDDYEAFLQAVADLALAADAALGQGCQAIGIGLPGVRDRGSGQQLSANVPALMDGSASKSFRASASFAAGTTTRPTSA